MPRYIAQKQPFQYRMHTWLQKNINDQLQRTSKAIPCHVTKVDKDFVEVQFETHDNTFTPPTVKLPQSFSPYAREPTQVGDKGYAVPSDYYLGGNSGEAGGATNYYPRGNLTNLSFQPLAQTQNPKRDYNQYTIVGGPNGIHMVQSGPPKQQSQTGQTGGAVGATQAATAGAGPQMTSAPAPWVRALNPARVAPVLRGKRMRFTHSVPGVGFYATMPIPAPLDSGQTDQNQPLPPVPDPTQNLDQPDKATLTIDQNAKHTLDGTNNHRMTIDQQNQRMTLEVPPDGAHFIWVGGDGKTGLYAPLMTSMGPVVNARGRIG